ncbi:hypothetical protein [Pseudonocardia sp. ICBG1293]|uniref:hypothetical protein n=1 Tax=Pseudonocardia sp. ICBG1293 TaxID=2844382 RepID=UPI001CC9DF2E|nr:hypothetical protein [Pseudonocardia sp. ICBG1293]
MSATARAVRSLAEIAVFAPVVIARRTARMLTSGFPPPAREVREYHRMWTEKVDGFSRAAVVLATSTPGPATVERALEPIRTRVRANARRLG